MAGPARVGIVGCGDVTGLYLPTIAGLPMIELAACADLDPARAEALSMSGGFPAVPVDALLADPTIEIVLNLTPPAAHAAVSLAAIRAGKHVYSEKPLATSRGDAADILAGASAAGVRVGAAPDTFLGAGLRTARALVDDGAIGTPLGASASVAHLGPERWHPNPSIFYAAGGGPLLDLGPYYVAALVDLLGPIERVSAVGRGVGGDRSIGHGPSTSATLTSAVPTTVIGTLEFASGAIAGLTASFDVAGSRAPHIEIHGTAGSLSLGDPNTFDAEVGFLPVGADDWQDIPLRSAAGGRGIGLADMVDAIREDRPHRASGRFAFHCLDVLLALEAAATGEGSVPIASSSDRPAA